MRTRPLWHCDEADVRSIFRETLLLGREIPAGWPDLDAYESLCLDWYLRRGRVDAAVLADDDGSTAGYVLVCVDTEHHRRWVRRAGLRFFMKVAPGLAAGHYPPEVAEFYRLRIRDGLDLWRGAPSLPGLGVVHMNMRPSVRAGAAGRLLADHADRRVISAGLSGWYGEINAPTGSRGRALERLGGTIVHRAPNRTLTGMLGRPVERLTVVRSLSADAA